MIETALPLAPECWAPVPAPDPSPLLEQLATLRPENAALRAQNAVLQARIRELEAHLGQNSSNSARPPSSDPPQAPAKRRPAPSGRKRGGQPGHRGAFRRLLPVEQVDEVVVVVPEICGHCGRPLGSTEGLDQPPAWRHQVVELLPLAVRVTEYRMVVRCCTHCGRRTRASLPAGVPRRPFGARLTAVIALLSGRYRLSRREVQQALQDLWEVRVSLGAVVRQERAQSAALAPVVEEAQAAVQQAEAVNLSEWGVMEAVLGAEFAGVVGTDRWSAYNRFPAQRRALCYAHLKRAFQGLVDRGGEAEPIGRWGLGEIARLFALWHRFRAGELDRPELRRRLVPLQARLGRLLRRGQANPERKRRGCAGSRRSGGRRCGRLPAWKGGLTKNVAERALRPAALWRKGCFGSASEAGSRFAERLLTVAATCRQQGRSLVDFLVAAGEAALQATAAPSLLLTRQG